MRAIVVNISRSRPQDTRSAEGLRVVEYNRHYEGQARSFSLDWRSLGADLSTLPGEGAGESVLGFGRNLRKALLPSGWEQIEAEISGALSQGPLELLLSMEPDELDALPWEAMPLGEHGEPLCGVSGLRIVHQKPGIRDAGGGWNPPARALLAWSFKGGAVPHLEVRGALQNWLGTKGVEECDLSLPALRDALSRAEPWDVLVLLAHGVRVGAQVGLAGEEGHFTPAALVEPLRRVQRPPRLILILACRAGAQPHHAEGYGALAVELHRASMPCVVAFRWDLSEVGAILLTQALFGTWARGTLPDALTAARDALTSTDRLGMQVLGLRPEPIQEPAPRRSASWVYVPRPELERQVLDALHARPPRPVAVIGMAGVGKTHLVEHLAQQHREARGVVYTLVLEQGGAVNDETLLTQMASQLGQDRDGRGAQDGLASRLAAQGAWVHIDNLDDPRRAQVVARFVERLPGVPVVVTGRAACIGASRGKWVTVTLGVLANEEPWEQLKLELLPEHATQAQRDELEACRGQYADLLTELSGLPLAIRLAAGYLQSGYSPSDFLLKLRRRKLDWRPADPQDLVYEPERRSLASTFALSLDLFEKECLGAGPALRCLGLGPLCGFSPSLGEALAALYGLDWKEVLIAASTLGLVTVERPTRAPQGAEQGSIKVHPLLAQYLRDGLDEAARDAALRRMDAWFLERLQDTPQERRQERWGALFENLGALQEWLGGLNAARALQAGRQGSVFAVENGPFHPWIGVYEKALSAQLDDSSRSELLLSLGEIYWNLGNFEDAWRVARQKEDLDRLRGWRHGQAAAARLRAEVLMSKGDLRQALRILQEEVLPAYVDSHQNRLRVIALTRMSDIHRELGEYDEALRIVQTESLPVFLSLGDHHNRVRALGRLAALHEAKGLHAEALQVREQELAEVKKYGGLRDQAVCLGDMAAALSAQGWYPEALDVCRDALSTWEKVGSWVDWVFEQAQLARIHTQMGQLEEASRVIERLQPRSTGAESADERTAVSHGIAYAMFGAGRRDEALRIWKDEVLPVQERRKDLSTQAFTWEWITRVHEDGGRAEEALSILEVTILPIWETLGRIQEQANTLDRIATLYSGLGMSEKAITIQKDRVLPLWEQLGDTLGQTITLGRIADLYTDMNRLREALEIREHKVLPLWEQLGDTRERAMALDRIADLYKDLGQLMEALQVRQGRELPLWVQLGDAREQAITWDRIADLCGGLGQLEQELEVRKDKVLPLWELFDASLEQANNLRRIADLYRDQGQLMEELTIREDKEIRVWESLGELRLQAITWGRIAELHYGLDHLKRAIGIQECKVLRIWEELGELQEQGKAWEWIASFRQDRGNVEGSMLAIEENVLPIAVRLGLVHELTDRLLVFAERYHVNGHSEAALVLLERLMNLLDPLRHLRERATVLGRVADIFQGCARYQHALRVRMEWELPAWRELGDETEARKTQLRVAELERLLLGGDPSAPVGDLDSALAED